ncbi:hypothetical protein GALMADRAFT_157006 [Galerina marginata CBS 339.88]|uniref:Uncharacterized protein n=1 Tax=Galerina marginata (strain CBS 339.88) TaxID=685588 RepID=A0A067T802_GALM3|nr:hypothetical protein GALMADRAFT_157006 [Galerina marginata CBS 339.88]
MNIFKRTKSIVTKNPGRQQDSTSSSSSSRQPLVQQTNIDLLSSQSSLSSRDDHSSLSDPSSLDSSHSKRLIARKISHRDVEEPNKSKISHISPSHSPEMQHSRGLAPPPRSPRSAKPNYSDMYTQNDLQTFSFGAAPSTPASSSVPPPVDPLSRPRDEADSDELSLIPDTTPRPSVVGSHYPRSHQSQPSGLEEWQPSFSPTRIKPPGKGARAEGKSRERDSDTMSTHTFGTSSASASVSSLPRLGGANSRADSRISGHSSTTPQTSANDLTSDEDEDMIGRHPLPPEPRDPSLANHFISPDQESSLYLSEEEFDGYEDFEPEIEIDSVANEASDRGTYYDFSNPSRESFTMDQGERRGSLAMAIPNTSSDRSYPDHRAREYSAVNTRRPSRSLEDLHSFSFAQGSGPYSSVSRQADEHPPPAAPTSVPESEGDWRDLRKRSIQRDKDLPPIMPVASSSSMAVASNSSNPNTSSRGTSAMDGFDTSWLQEYGVNGVVGFDPSEMADIVEEGNLNGHRPSLYSFRKGSAASAARRHSTVSSNIDIMHKNIVGQWSNQKFRDQRQMWRFTREMDRQDEDGNRNHNSGQERERERPSISTLFASRPSTSGEHSNGPIPFFDKPEGKDKAAAVKSKEKPHKEPWRGMALDSEEIWFNGASGKFRVNRRNAIPVEHGKPPQQRLNITYIRSPYILNATNRDPADGPAITIHKHSKAAAFSISRHYRTRPPANGNSGGATSPHDTTVSLRHNTSSVGQVSSKDSAEGSRKKGNMILLGTRRVQRAYTSTNTTRKLESHGLLDDNGRTSPKDVERMRRDEHERQRSKGKEKERKDKDKDKGKRKAVEAPAVKRLTAKGESKSRDSKHKESKSKDIPGPAQPLPDSSEGSSAGSVANALSSGDSGTLVNSSTAVTTPEHTDATNSAGSVGSVEQSILSQETTSSDRTISRANFYRSPPRRRGVYDIDDDYDDEDSSEERPRYPTRTPHRETYAALPPEVFESVHQEHPHTGLFGGWGRSKGSDRSVPRPNPYEQSYNPPWPVTQPRSNSETRKGIVDDLNMSFQDVGLLPALGEIKGSSSHNGQHKRKRDQHPKKHVKRPSDKTQIDIFEEVPDDALYMLLPLWPGETDPSSAKKYPYSSPAIPTNARQYLLIYWRSHVTPPPVNQEEGTSKSKSGDKKRSQESPVSSGDNVNDRVVLLHSFHISGRVFAYRDLQGSGVRIPDVGLAVSGPLKDAYDSIPDTIRKDDYVIGVCHSRESGIEFIPEGFEKMGLSRTIPNPRPAEPSEDDDSQSFDTIPVLTPIGRAVMEMAWLGSMAVTSFNPNL